jgi:hypothetical protein
MEREKMKNELRGEKGRIFILYVETFSHPQK